MIGFPDPRSRRLIGRDKTTSVSANRTKKREYRYDFDTKAGSDDISATMTGNTSDLEKKKSNPIDNAYFRYSKLLSCHGNFLQT